NSMKGIAALAFAPLLACAAPTDISAELAELHDSRQVPALAAAVVMNGKIVALGVSGVRKFGTDKAATIDDRFHLGSCAKSMTASVAAMLVREQKIDWTTT